ncbi:MAG: DUF2752 domain-containing protein [Capnocytophaga sp.]|nr:DUF2752 domain-containing protein [Capnocytophaga sp.]
MTVKNVYILLVASCLVGWGWLLSNFLFQQHDIGITVCLSKHITDIPCPSCGTTRSVLSFFNGNFIKSLYWNPLGVLASLALIILPFMMLYDWIFRKITTYKAYIGLEKYFKKAYVYIPFFVLILLNWIWNICKGL